MGVFPDEISIWNREPSPVPGHPIHPGPEDPKTEGG
jgi:hypothetical protein